MINTSVRQKTQESNFFQKSRIIPWQQSCKNFVCGCGCGNTWFKSFQLIWIQTHDLPSIFVPSCPRCNDTSWCKKNETIGKFFRLGNQRFLLDPCVLGAAIEKFLWYDFQILLPESRRNFDKNWNSHCQTFSCTVKFGNENTTLSMCLTIFWKKDK